MNALLGRIYQDYFMPGRWQEYESLLRAALDAGYVFLPHRELGSLREGQKTFFLRHDVDSDVPLAGKMLAIESRLGIRSTYYLRLCTLDGELIGQARQAGCEIGYHYEELAAYAKAHRLRDPAQVMDALPTIQKEFIHNFHAFVDKAGEVTTAASHGDFVNRRLGLRNTCLLTPALRRELGIVLEAYDPALESRVTARISDREYPALWSPEPPEAAVARGETVILTLVHPRQWQRAPLSRLGQDWTRLREGVRYGKQ
ncbi:MAG: hypothetical protein PHD32_03305 [Eubacteriales bacterium]|nr:hypothetical protein [Eubacteriales bacterium]